MEIRNARPQDRPALRDVARRSLQASYPLDAEAITSAVDEWYDENRLHDRLRSDDELLLVADVDGEVVAFADVSYTGERTGELYWLHVDPAYRSENHGKELFDAVRDHLDARGATTLRGRVLAVNKAGNAFYERHGLTKVGEETVEIDDTPYMQYIYTELDADRVEELQTDDVTVYIDHDNTERGSLAAFSVTYADPSGETLYGYWCQNCDTIANAMDAMGRIRCDNCGNTRKGSRWDAAY